VNVGEPARGGGYAIDLKDPDVRAAIIDTAESDREKSMRDAAAQLLRQP
jgi:hypothetical protein